MPERRRFLPEKQQHPTIKKNPVLVRDENQAGQSLDQLAWKTGFLSKQPIHELDRFEAASVIIHFMLPTVKPTEKIWQYLR